MPNIEFTYFDLGNVLFTFSGGIEKIAEKTQKPKEEVERIWRKYDDAICRGEMTPQQLWEKYQQELPTEELIKDFASFWTEHFKPIMETVELLLKLQKANIAFGVLSNIYPGVFELIQQKNLIPRINWSEIVLSCNEGNVKPEPEIFAAAEKKAKVAPEKILFIDDRQDFIEPARQRGWQTHQFDYKNPTNSIATIEKLLIN